MAEPAQPRRMMELVTGYWASQAVYVAAKTGIADHLAERPMTTAELAEATSTRPEALHRLLRFLVDLGVLRRDGGAGFALTELGELLRSDQPGSMRQLAVLYGEEFYHAWGELLHTVRTGEQAFAHLYGSGMYPYFARSPERARVFDEAMAAGSSVFDELHRALDFGDAHRVVDVAGGNGTLLLALLRSCPWLTGVLFDAPHVVEAARTALAGQPGADRIEFVGGDFYDTIPSGGDVYVLSRILHGRDDDGCLRLLANVSVAMAPGGRLLVLERVIAEDGTPSLATWFDVHMMTVAGGVERTDTEYRELLGKAGFALDSVADLPLDMRLLVATRS